MAKGTYMINVTQYVYEVDGVFVPNKKYKLQKELAESKKRGPVAITECKHKFYGTTYLFDAIGEKLGVTSYLKKCFPETYQKILSIAYYLILEDRNPLSRFPKRSRTHLHPFGGEYLFAA